ncbi:MAG: hypothetical protein K2J18_01120, partial [Paramuribaculum sp.]|nr:hypothetical protein [Paramuribaculum sp.]
ATLVFSEMGLWREVIRAFAVWGQPAVPYAAVLWGLYAWSKESGSDRGYGGMREYLCRMSVGNMLYDIVRDNGLQRPKVYFFADK